jgi:hypothetical protein
MAAATLAGEVPVAVGAASEREPIASKFALEGEGDRFVSGVKGIWIIGMGAADAASEFGLRFRVGYGPNKFGFGESFLDTCERVEVGFRCVTKRWTI